MIIQEKHPSVSGYCQNLNLGLQIPSQAVTVSLNRNCPFLIFVYKFCNTIENYFSYIFVNYRLWYHLYQEKHGNVRCLFVVMMEYLKKILSKIEGKAWKFLLTSECTVLCITENCSFSCKKI